MNKGDILVCIKPFYLEKYVVNGAILASEVNLKIGDQYTIVDISDYTGEGLVKYDDVQVFFVSNGKTSTTFWSKELRYRKCIHDYFTPLGTLRDKRIDEILKND